MIICAPSCFNAESAFACSGKSNNDIPQLAIQCLDVVLKHAVLMNPARLVIGRGTIFDTNQTGAQGSSLGGGAEAWKGYSQSLRPSEGGLTLNVDKACTAFLQTRPVIEYLADVSGVPFAAIRSGMSPDQFRKARRAIQGLKVPCFTLPMQLRTHSLSCQAFMSLSSAHALSLGLFISLSSSLENDVFFILTCVPRAALAV